MPRRYTLGKRGHAMTETRERIVAATLRIYREQGIESATVPAVARVADVAPATVRNHFPTPGDLAEAAAAAILEDVRMPDPTIFDGAGGTIDRVERLLVELGAFFERSTGWWQVREADRHAGNAWAAPEAAYERRIVALIEAAVEPLDDDSVVSVVGAVLVHVYFAARSAGQSSEAAIEIERSLLLPWLSDRLARR